MTYTIHPIPPETIVQSLDALRELPALLTTIQQVRDFDGSAFYSALETVMTTVHRLERQAIILILEEAISEQGLASVTIQDSGDDFFYVTGTYANGEVVDEENIGSLADDINTRMDSHIEDFLRDYLVDKTVTMDYLKTVARKSLGLDFTAAREAEAMNQALPDTGEKNKRATRRM